jgi:hypothetical protein
MMSRFIAFMFQLIAMGAIIPTTKQLRDQEWQNLRRQTVNKFNESKKTGAAGSTLSTLDNIVMDIVGRNSVKVNALNIEDSPVVFNQSTTQGNKVNEEVLYEVVIDEHASSADELFSGNPVIPQESIASSSTSTVLGILRASSSTSTVLGILSQFYQIMVNIDKRYHYRQVLTRFRLPLVIVWRWPLTKARLISYIVILRRKLRNTSE